MYMANRDSALHLKISTGWVFSDSARVSTCIVKVLDQLLKLSLTVRSGECLKSEPVPAWCFTLATPSPLNMPGLYPIRLDP